MSQYRKLQKAVREINDKSFFNKIPQYLVKKGTHINSKQTAVTLEYILNGYGHFIMTRTANKHIKDITDNGITTIPNTDTEALYELITRIQSKLPGIKLMFKFHYIDKFGVDSSRSYNDFSNIQYIYDAYKDVLDINSIVKSVDVYILKEAKHKLKTGAFFAYINKSGIDLTSYDIFDVIPDQIGACFINAIRKQLPEDIMKRIILQLQRREVTRADIVRTCNSVKFICYISYYKNSKIRMDKIGSQGPAVYIALYKNHYFQMENTDMTLLYVRNYKSIPNLPKSVCKIRDYNRFECYNPRYLNSLQLIHLIDDMGEFEAISLGESIYNKIDYNETDIYSCCLDVPNIESEELHVKSSYMRSFIDNVPLNLMEWKSNGLLGDTKKRPIIYADFEASTCDNSGNPLPSHIPYLWAICDEMGRVYNYFSNDYNRLIMFFLDKIFQITIRENRGPPIVYFHNLKYDLSFFITYLLNIRVCEKDNNIYNIIARYKHIDIEFRDSYKMISTKLSMFPKMFHIEDIKKEAFPYDYYTPERISIFTDSYIETMDMSIYFQTDYDVFRQNTEHGFNPIMYAKFYCNQDVKILMQGMTIFNNQCKEALNMCTFEYLTSSSLASRYLHNRGCYDGVLPVSGITQLFISASVKGGRCMTARNEKIHVIGRIADFDAVSLYPTAMSEIMGFPVGNPILIDVFDPMCTDLYFVRISLTDAFYNRGFNYDFPLFWDEVETVESIPNAITGVSVDKKLKQILYVNEPKRRKFIMDRVTLQECMRHYNMELNVHFTFECGIIYPQGYNDTVCNVMKELFMKRLELKNAGNPLQEIYKLIMNSAYGKTLIKDSNTKCKITDTNESYFNNFLYNNYHNIKEVEYFNGFNNKQMAIIRIYKSMYEQHKNYSHCGSYILSQSKAIMNRVFFKAHNIGVPIFYQDTDSLHMYESDISKFGDIIGREMGCFHNDFSSSRIVTDIHSKEFISVGKKMYLDILCGVDDDGNEVEDYHIRLKGVPTESLIQHCKDNRIDIREFYMSLYRGDSHKIDLLNAGIKFKFTGYTVSSCIKFERTIRATV